MAKSRLNSKSQDRPVLIYGKIHRRLKRIAFLCETTIERLVNNLLEKDIEDRERLEKLLLELEIDPKCLDETT